MFDLSLMYILNWVFQLIGVKYTPVCDDYMVIINNVPMYGIFNQLPSIEFIKHHGCNCVGLINLLRLKNNKSIPGYKDDEIKKYNYVGSIGIWIRQLKNSNSLYPYDKNNGYDIGTLLIKPSYTNDFGHMAILIGHNKILHSDRNLGICVSDLTDLSFTYSCPPSIWLYTDF
jgi:hypothetical protein